MHLPQSNGDTAPDLGAVEGAKRASVDPPNELSTVIERLTDGVLAFDRDWLCTYTNAAAARQFGRRREAFVGLTTRDFFPEAVTLLLHDAARRAETGGEPVAVDACPLPLDRWFDFTLYPSSDGFTIVSRDITEHRRAEETLRLSEAKYRTLIDAMDQGVIFADVIFDDDGRPADVFYREANSAAVKMVNAEFSGRRLSEVLSEHERHWYEVPGRVASTGIAQRLELYAEQLQQWFDMYIVKIGDEAGQVAIIFQDTTAEKRADALLRARKQR